MTARSMHLDAPQGADEERTEPYPAYGEGVPQAATQRSAKSSGRVSGSAGKQAAAVRGAYAPIAAPVASPIALSRPGQNPWPHSQSQQIKPPTFSLHLGGSS